MRGRKVKSRSAHRTQLKLRRMLPSWCKECFMLREKSLARRPWPAVVDLPSEVHVHSHGRSCTEIAADDADNINILASSIFLTTSPKSENCFRMWLLLKVVWLASNRFCQKRGETTFKGLIQSGLFKNLLPKFAFKSKKCFLTNLFVLLFAFIYKLKFEKAGGECERKLWDSQNHFVSHCFKSVFLLSNF